MGDIYLDRHVCPLKLAALKSAGGLVELNLQEVLLRTTCERDCPGPKHYELLLRAGEYLTAGICPYAEDFNAQPVE